MAWWVARATVEANAWGPQRLRNSVSAPRRSGPGVPGRRKSLRPAVAVPPALGGHGIVRASPGRIRQRVCRACRRSSAKRFPFAASSCPFSAAARWAQQAVIAARAGAPIGPGHVLLLSDSVTWCFRCGAYSSARVHLLQRPCPGSVAASWSRRTSRQRLLLGLHPVTRISLASGVVPEPGAVLPVGLAGAVRAAQRTKTRAACTASPAQRTARAKRGARSVQRAPPDGQGGAAGPAPEPAPAWRIAMLARLAARLAARRAEIAMAAPPPPAVRRRLSRKQPME